jgi:Ni/Fe-hydrogenase 1 B-type cytochrome subunit
MSTPPGKGSVAKLRPSGALRGISLAHKVPPPSGDYHWIYLWGWPIRAMHWLAVGCIVVLVVTGFYIGRPYFITSGEATAHYLMGWVRFLHFAAAGILVATAIVRLYWLFVGNRFERWRALFPVRASDWANLWKQIKFYLMIRPEQAPQWLGHNPLQQFSYTGLYGIALLQAITGFAMYGQARPEGFWYTLFGWVVPLLGGIQIVHFVHHILTWVFLIFIPIHIYLALRADLLERTGTISSIVSGGRFVRSDVTYVDQP